MLENKIRVNIAAAVQKKNKIEKNILRLALGEIQRETSTKELSETDKENIVRKLIKSNNKTIFLTENDNTKNELTKENEILQLLLPEEMTKTDVLAFITGYDVKMVEDNVGKSIGNVMRAMKENKIVVDSNVVKEVVNDLIKTKV